MTVPEKFSTILYLLEKLNITKLLNCQCIEEQGLWCPEHFLKSKPEIEPRKCSPPCFVLSLNLMQLCIGTLFDWEKQTFWLLTLLKGLEAALVNWITIYVVACLLLQKNVVQKFLHLGRGHVEFFFQVVWLVFLQIQYVLVTADLHHNFIISKQRDKWFYNFCKSRKCPKILFSLILLVPLSWKEI